MKLYDKVSTGLHGFDQVIRLILNLRLTLIRRMVLKLISYSVVRCKPKV
jgi:hypothetical protein